jgi:parallel beta-helix repeat protein
VTGVRVYGRINGSSENLFEDNEISGSANYGIFMYDAAVGNTFSSNQVISNGDSGIYLKSVFDNLFSDNEVSNNEFGLRLDSTESKTLSSGNQFKNNIVQGNHYGLYSYPPPDSNIFENNRITDNGANVTYLDPQPSGRSLLEIARLTLFGLIITVALITAIVFIVRWQRQQPPPGGRRI